MHFNYTCEKRLSSNLFALAALISRISSLVPSPAMPSIGTR